jgi:hypothetical protein
MNKPLGRKGYGSIGHLPNSRLTDGSDFHVNDVQASLVTDKTRDRYDLVIVQEKLDGSNCSVGLINGELIPVTRKGYHANTSPYEMHHMFAKWVWFRYRRSIAHRIAVLHAKEKWLAQSKEVKESI